MASLYDGGASVSIGLQTEGGTLARLVARRSTGWALFRQSMGSYHTGTPKSITRNESFIMCAFFERDMLKALAFLWRTQSRKV